MNGREGEPEWDATFYVSRRLPAVGAYHELWAISDENRRPRPLNVRFVGSRSDLRELAGLLGGALQPGGEW